MFSLYTFKFMRVSVKKATTIDPHRVISFFFVSSVALREKEVEILSRHGIEGKGRHLTLYSELNDIVDVSTENRCRCLF